MREDSVAEPASPDYVVKNRVQPEDECIHGWYRFVLGYPPHLVRQYLATFEADPDTDWVLDPFAGTGTTPVEARLRGHRTLSVEANPVCALACRVKLGWDLGLEELRDALRGCLEAASESLAEDGISPFCGGSRQTRLFEGRPRQRPAPGAGAHYGSPGIADLLSEQAARLVPSGFISPLPLKKVLALREAIDVQPKDRAVHEFLLLALASTIVGTAGNVGFGPEVYRLPPKEDADVLGAFADTVDRMICDLKLVQSSMARPFPAAHVFCDDARTLLSLKAQPRAGIVITSPPYPNEKDYTRSTRLESVLLGLLSSRDDLRRVKSTLLRSNTRTVFVRDDDDQHILDVPSVTAIADEIERRRLALGKTSGFERLYHRVTRLYFGGMYRHFLALRRLLAPGARCAYVVGDQMSYFRIHIRTAALLADVALKAGYSVDGIELWRTRRSTATGLDLEENVLLLRA